MKTHHQKTEERENIEKIVVIVTGIRYIRYPTQKETTTKKGEKGRNASKYHNSRGGSDREVLSLLSPPETHLVGFRTKIRRDSWK